MNIRHPVRHSRPGTVILALLLATPLGMLPSLGAAAVSEDSVVAAYVYRFAGYIEWPEPDRTASDFTIAVLDAPGVANELRRLLANRFIKDRPVRVREVTGLEALGDAQILYVGAGQADRVRGLAPRAGHRAILVVTNEEGGLAAGSVINLVQVAQTIRFEISVAAARRWGLKISSDLLSVAVRIADAHPQSQPLG